MKPVLIKYFDTSNATYNTEYLINKDNTKVYICSKIAYKVACDLGKENELYKVNTRTLLLDWCNYHEVYNNSFNFHIPKIIEKNYEKILGISEENFGGLVRIVEFLEEFYEYSCKKDFVKTCKIALIITEKYLSREIIQTLFNMVFEFYCELVEEKKLELLLDIHISEFFVCYEEKS